MWLPGNPVLHTNVEPEQRRLEKDYGEVHTELFTKQGYIKSPKVQSLLFSVIQNLESNIIWKNLKILKDNTGAVVLISRRCLREGEALINGQSGLISFVYFMKNSGEAGRFFCLLYEKQWAG